MTVAGASTWCALMYARAFTTPARLGARAVPSTTFFAISGLGMSTVSCYAPGAPGSPGAAGAHGLKVAANSLKKGAFVTGSSFGS